MRTRESLTALIEGRLSSPDGRSELVRLATRLILEEALEAETRDALGRDYYERGAEEGRGYRNGHRTGRLKTAEGAIEFSTPQIAGRDEPFRSGSGSMPRGAPRHSRTSPSRCWPAGFRSGTSRTPSAPTTAGSCSRAPLCPSWASSSGGTTRTSRTGDLGEHEIVYLFVDGIAERIRPGQRREPVMAAWGFTATGSRVLLHLMAGSKEDAETVTAFFQDMRARGLGDPAACRLRRRARRDQGHRDLLSTLGPQRCLAHRMRNLAAKVPEDVWPEVKARIQAAYQGPEPGDRARAGQGRGGGLRKGASPRRSPASWTTSRPASPTCACPSPTVERSEPRTFSSGLFVEERRRLKIIPNAFGERPVLKLMFGAMTRAAERWRSIRFTEFERRQIAAVRKDLDAEYEARTHHAPPLQRRLTSPEYPALLGLDQPEDLAPLPPAVLLASWSM
jgi:transposase-like protein